MRGPYDLEKMRSLVDRGRLGRHLQVSVDGRTWNRATEFPELFSTGPDAKPSQPKARSGGPSNHESQKWYVNQFGEKSGPPTVFWIEANGRRRPSDAGSSRVDGTHGRLGSDCDNSSPFSSRRKKSGSAEISPQSSMQPLSVSRFCGLTSEVNPSRCNLHQFESSEQSRTSQIRSSVHSDGRR